MVGYVIIVYCILCVLYSEPMSWAVIDVMFVILDFSAFFSFIVQALLCFLMCII